MLLVSEKWYGLLNMGTRIFARVSAGRCCRRRIWREKTTTLLWRLLDAGPVEAEVNIAGKLQRKAGDRCTTRWRKFTGSEKPDEVVIIGGHLDSWDLGTGATDNGTGSMAVLAAARALQKVGREAEAHDSVRAVHRRRAGIEWFEGVREGAQG